MRTLWKKPELIILVRGKPEEAVLEACKVEGIQGKGLLIAHCEQYSVGGPCYDMVSS